MVFVYFSFKVRWFISIIRHDWIADLRQTLVAFSQNQLEHPAEFQKALKLHLQMLVEIQETELDKKMEQVIWW